MSQDMSLFKNSSLFIILDDERELCEIYKISSEAKNNWSVKCSRRNIAEISIRLT